MIRGYVQVDSEKEDHGRCSGKLGEVVGAVKVEFVGGSVLLLQALLDHETCRTK